MLNRCLNMVSRHEIGLLISRVIHCRADPSIVEFREVPLTALSFEQWQHVAEKSVSKLTSCCRRVSGPHGVHGRRGAGGHDRRQVHLRPRHHRHRGNSLHRLRHRIHLHRPQQARHRRHSGYSGRWKKVDFLLMSTHYNFLESFT